MIEEFPQYEEAISYLLDKLEKGTTPDEIRNNGDMYCKFGSYPEWAINYWSELVDKAIEYREKMTPIEIDVAQSGLWLRPRNNLTVMRDPNSCWQLYYSSLNFSNKKRIELECFSVLGQLSLETDPNYPTKGLVVGNVQSGKTTNMAGVISMAMDYKWNVIVVLTGTIEALRKQTFRRLHNELKAVQDPRSPFFRDIRWPEIGSDGEFTEKIKLNMDQKVYVVVSLKQSDNLKKLIKLLNWSPEYKSKMRVLVIDDEADQASVNTSDLSGDADGLRDRKAINRLIVDLISGYDHEDNPAGGYLAMNYVAYTATPYANLLSEKELRGEEVDGEDEQLYSNLYPKDFIMLLNPAKEYFGPPQLFGYPPEGLHGLNIFNTGEDTSAVVKQYKRGDPLPAGLKDAISWFVCCVAIKRRWIDKEPVSMLVNPDMSTEIHALLADGIKDYLSNNKEEIMSRCRRVYDQQTKMMSASQFKEWMGAIGYNGVAVGEDGKLLVPYCDESTVIRDYPAFEEIEDDVSSLLDIAPEPYFVDDNKEIHYHKGIHICIDNSRGNSMPRLIYPDKDELKERCMDYPSPSPAMIVIGGNTLSRGLTLEGLVCTYFARNMGQADTSMQMCRWFGYRRGYELLPRIWISPRILRKYHKTVDIDESVRAFIRENYSQYTPMDMVMAIKNYPGLRATSRSKSREAVAIDYDYTGYTRATSKFYKDEATIDRNMSLTHDFLIKLHYTQCAFMREGGKSLWAMADHDDVMRFLRGYDSPCTKDDDGRIEIDLGAIEKKLVDKGVKEWVVVVGNPLGSPRSWITLDGHNIGLAGRSGKDVDNVVEIASRLINPRDQYADCDPNDFVNPRRDPLMAGWTFERFDNHVYEKYTIREGCKRLQYPVLIIYGISGQKLDDNSKGLGLSKDVIGLCVQMPGKKSELGAATLLRLDIGDNGGTNGERFLCLGKGHIPNLGVVPFAQGAQCKDTN